MTGPSKWDETVILGIHVMHGFFNQVIVGHVELEDFNLVFDALVAKLLQGVAAGGDIAAGKEEKGGGGALSDDLGGCKAEVLICTCRENDMRRHGKGRKRSVVS